MRHKADTGVFESDAFRREYLSTVAKHRTAINFGGYVGHTTVRLYVMGVDAFERAVLGKKGDRYVALMYASSISRAICHCASGWRGRFRSRITATSPVLSRRRSTALYSGRDHALGVP